MKRSARVWVLYREIGAWHHYMLAAHAYYQPRDGDE